MSSLAISAGNHLQAVVKTPSVTSPKRSVTFQNSAVTMPKRAVTMGRYARLDIVQLTSMHRAESLLPGGRGAQLMANETVPPRVR